MVCGWQGERLRWVTDREQTGEIRQVVVGSEMGGGSRGCAGVFGVRPEIAARAAYVFQG